VGVVAFATEMTAKADSFEPDRAVIERVFAGATAVELVYTAHQYLRFGASASVIALCDAARGRGVNDPGLVLLEATARFGAGEHARALGAIDEVLAGAPDNLGALALKAHMMAALGNAGLARSLAIRAVDGYSDYPGALSLLAAIAFPGPHYHEVLARLHALLAPSTYLEIGVDTGTTLALASTASIAVGVDPNASVSRPPRSNARLYALKSDDFFGNETLATAFGGRSVDLTFIDGMHLFEYALRDFANAERWSSPSSTIVLHDCLPVSRKAALRERDSTFWVGDVWKVVEVLLDHRPDLRVFMVPTAPSGLVIVRGLDPDSSVLFARYDEIVSRYRELPYPSSDGTWPSRYQVVKNSEEGVRQAISR
jgi:hypothetical protein